MDTLIPRPLRPWQDEINAKSNVYLSLFLLEDDPHYVKPSRTAKEMDDPSPNTLSTKRDVYRHKRTSKTLWSEQDYRWVSVRQQRKTSRRICHQSTYQQPCRHQSNNQLPCRGHFPSLLEETISPQHRNDNHFEGNLAGQTQDEA